MKNAADTKPVSIADIARELGVSKSTVSRALSGKGRIGEVMRRKVLDVSRQMNYKAPDAVCSVKNQIAVVIPQDADTGDIPFFQNCLLKISECLYRLGFDTVLVVEKNNDIGPLRRLVSGGKIDGVILTRIEDGDCAVEYLKEENVPFVVMGTSEEDIIQIDSDQASGCFEMTKFMIGKGCSNVAVLGGNKNYLVNRDRFSGFERAWKESGLDDKDYSVHWNLDCQEVLFSILPTLMKENPQCIVCLDDTVCVQVLKWLSVNDYEVPADIQVISFYDNVVLENHNPPVTALKVDIHELAKRITALICDMVKGRNVPGHSRISYEIKIRESFR